MNTLMKHIESLIAKNSLPTLRVFHVQVVQIKIFFGVRA